MEQGKSSKKVFWVVLVLLAVLLLGLLVYYLMQNGFSLSVPFLANSSYQAVFLTNGQVYFGKLSGLNSDFPTLTDVYYLRVNEVLQPVQGKKQEPQQQLSLAKLGTVELHKPEDMMRINQDHILFVEDLARDSQVTQAIRKYKEGL
ncbi:MAG: hypothetical protein AAB646_01465 [Patescibacteria group bacterium]